MTLIVTNNLVSFPSSDTNHSWIHYQVWNKSKGNRTHLFHQSRYSICPFQSGTWQCIQLWPHPLRWFHSVFWVGKSFHSCCSAFLGRRSASLTSVSHRASSVYIFSDRVCIYLDRFEPHKLGKCSCKLGGTNYSINHIKAHYGIEPLAHSASKSYTNISSCNYLYVL